MPRNKRPRPRQKVSESSDSKNKRLIHVTESVIPARAGRESLSLRGVGIQHSQLSWMENPLKIMRIRRELKKEQALIFSEFEGKHYIPRSARTRWRWMDNSPVRDYVVSAARRLPIWKVIFFSGELLLRDIRMWGKVPPIMRASPGRKRLNSDEFSSLARFSGVSEKEARAWFGLLVNTRSLLMSYAILMKSRSENAKSATFLTGKYHMTDINRFALDPVLAVRYARFAVRNLSALEKKYLDHRDRSTARAVKDMIFYLSLARDFFEREAK